MKGVNFAGLKDVNDPVTLARFYNEQGADELVFYDITASAEERGLFTDILQRVASEVSHDPPLRSHRSRSSPVVDTPSLILEGTP